MNLHPDYPIIEGQYQVTRNWSVELPMKFNKRIEESDLMLWRPGLTIYLAAWGNDENQTKEDLLAELQKDIADEAFDIKDDSPSCFSFSYRLNENSDDDRAPAFYCYRVDDCGFLQVAMYFDEEESLDLANQIYYSIVATELK